MAYDPDEKFRQDKEKAEKQQALYDEILQSLKNDNRFKEEFEKYDEGSVEEFYQDYASEKVRVLSYGSLYMKRQEENDLQWVDEATNGLNQIQQKKLFDLQCLWRAEQIELPEVSVCADFEYWEEHIFNCPFLDPVTEEEVAIYHKYLLSNNYESEFGFGDPWQDYKEIKEAYHSENENMNFPEWYDYHNSCTGKSIYLSLPDIRGQKEEYYLELGYNDRVEKMHEKQQQSEVVPVERKPYLHCDKEQLHWFARTFDNEETRKHLNDYERLVHDEDDRYKEAVDLVEELCENCEIWPIEHCHDWLEGLEKCLKSYKTSKTAEALGEAYEQYMMHINSGIGFADKENDYERERIDYDKEAILRGRELCGEPKDFNF